MKAGAFSATMEVSIVNRNFYGSTVVSVYYRFYYEWWLSYADLYYFMEYMR